MILGQAMGVCGYLTVAGYARSSRSPVPVPPLIATQAAAEARSPALTIQVIAHATAPMRFSEPRECSPPSAAESHREGRAEEL
jgi:hypothetical protein